MASTARVCDLNTRIPCSSLPWNLPKAEAKQQRCRGSAGRLVCGWGEDGAGTSPHPGMLSLPPAPPELHPPFPNTSFPGCAKKPTKTAAFCGWTITLVFPVSAEAGDVLGSGLSSRNRAAWSTLRAPRGGEGGGTPGREANRILRSCS